MKTTKKAFALTAAAAALGAGLLAGGTADAHAYRPIELKGDFLTPGECYTVLNGWVAWADPEGIPDGRSIDVQMPCVRQIDGDYRLYAIIHDNPNFEPYDPGRGMG